MEDYKITINKSSKNASLERYIIGNDAENLQANLVFVFDEFVNGQARLEYEFDNKKNWIPLEKVGESYKIPVRSVLTRKGMTRMQLVITQGIDVNEIPIFKSNVFVVYCGESLNVIAEAPEGYNEWLEFANTKLNQMDNINVEAVKVGNKGIITLTRRDGSQDVIEIYDGEKGDKGDKGDTYELTDKDRLEIGNIASSNAESTFKKYYDGKLEGFNTNATNKTSDFDSNATNKVEAYNTNATNKTKEYNENTTSKTKSFNENATNKTNDYDTNHDDKLKAYNDNATTQTNSYNTNANKKLEAYDTNDTTKTTAYNENTAQKTKEFNLNAKTKLDEFNQNAASYDQRINDNFDEINRLTDEVSENDLKIQRNLKRIENVETAIYTRGEAQGEFINIQDSSLSNVREIKGSVNKPQDTTKGINLTSIESNVETNYSIGKIAKKGNYSFIFTENSELGDIYNNLKILTTEGKKDVFSSYSHIKGLNVITFDCQYLGTLLYNGYGSNDCNMTNIMLVKGTYNTGNAPKFEEYSGGIPAPNPNFSREVTKQSGVVEITSCGENLLNEEEFIRQINLTSTATKEKYKGKDCIKITYGSTKNGFNLKTKPNTQYTIKFNLATINNNYYVYALYEDGTKILVNAERLDDYKHFKVVTEKNKTFKGITINIFKYNVELYFNELDIKEGAKDTPYKPYQAITEKVDLKENVMLPKDELEIKLDETTQKHKAFLHKNIGNKKYSNSEIDIVNDYSNITYAVIQKDIQDINYNKIENVKVICNKATYTYGGRFDDEYKIGKIIGYAWAGNYWIGFPKGTTLEEMKTKLDGLEICYELADKFKEVIDLGEVNPLMTYNPITNIFSNRVNLLLDVSYNRDFVYTIKNLQVDKDTLENQLKDLETRVLALENKPATIESEVIPNEDIHTQ